MLQVWQLRLCICILFDRDGHRQRKIDAHLTITLAHTHLQPISLRSSVLLDINYICRSDLHTCVFVFSAVNFQVSDTRIHDFREAI